MNTKKQKIANGPFQRTNASSEPTNATFQPFSILPKKGIFSILLKNRHPFFGEFWVFFGVFWQEIFEVFRVPAEHFMGRNEERDFMGVPSERFV